MKVRVWGKVFNFSMSAAKNEIKPSFIISWLSIKVMNRRLRSAIWPFITFYQWMTNLIEFSLLSFLSETRGVCDPSCVVLSPLYSSHSETNLSRFFTDSLLVVFCLAVLRVLCAWSESLSFQVGGGDDAGKVVTLFFMWTYLSISSISDYNECESGGICHNTTITGAPMRWRERERGQKKSSQDSRKSFLQKQTIIHSWWSVSSLQKLSSSPSCTAP